MKIEKCVGCVEMTQNLRQLVAFAPISGFFYSTYMYNQKSIHIEKKEKRAKMRRLVAHGGNHG